MYNRNVRVDRRVLRSHVAMIALGAAVPVLAVGYFVTRPGTEHARLSSADTQVLPSADWPQSWASAPEAMASGSTAPQTTAPGSPGDGGWGRGGYPMMAGPGRSDQGGFDQGGTGQGGTGQGDTGQGGVNGPAGTNAAVTTVASQNWAGYAATGPAGSFSNVSASWAQPAVTCGAANTFSSFWVGLDGDGTPTVEQTGTEADCADGTATYQGWYEVFPNAPVFFPADTDPVQPGDAMSASVAAGGNGVFTLTLSDATQGWTQTTRQLETAAQLGSAEVIAEAPSDGAVLPLADFGTVNFTGATVDGAPLGSSANLSELIMESAVSGSGAPLATPSALNGANAFSVTADQAHQAGIGDQG